MNKEKFLVGQYKNVKPDIKQTEINCKKNNLDGYKNQLISLISPTPRYVFKVEKYIPKLSKRQLKDFIYYNHGY